MQIPSTESVVDVIRAELAMLDPDVAVERVAPDTEIATLELESITLMSLMAELETRYGIRIPNHELTEIHLVRDVVGLIQRHVETDAAPGSA